jgi:hypothetical protein
MYVTIKTSDRSFMTDPERWLGQSSYFNNLFSGKWVDKQEDGSYFIKTDAHVFEHILRYLRTGVLPIFYDKVAGHDFPLYEALLDESTYFAIDRPEKWVSEANTQTLLKSTISLPRLKIEDLTENTLRMTPAVAQLWSRIGSLKLKQAAIWTSR